MQKKKNRQIRQLEEAHSHAFRSREELEKSTQAGCFYCLEIFDPLEIREWWDRYNRKTQMPHDTVTWTAVCPRCGIDSVLGNASGLVINKEFLTEMNRYWFGDARTL